MSDQKPQKGDLVRISLVGQIVEVYEEEDYESGYLLFVHGEEVPILASQVVEVFASDKRQEQLAKIEEDRATEEDA